MFANIKRLAKESLVYGVGRVASQLLQVFLIPLYTRVFSPADMGTVDVITTVTTMLTSVLILGTDTALSLYYYDDEDKVRRSKLLSTAFYSRLTLTTIVTVVLMAASPAMSQLVFGDTVHTQPLQLAFAALPAMLAIHLFVHLLRLRFALWKFNLMTIGFLLSSVALNVYLVVYLHEGILGVMRSTLVANCLLAVLGLYFTKSDFGLTFSFAWLGSLLRIGLPMLPASVSYVVLRSSDRFFLLKYTNLHEVGLYAVGLKLASVIGLVTATFQMAWTPFALSIARQEKARATYARVLTYYVGITSFLALGVSTFSPEILRVFTTPEYMGASKVVGLLSFSLIAYGAYFIVTIGLQLMKKTIHVGWTAVSAAVVTLLLNFLLVPRWGVVGAALAALAANWFSSFLGYKLAQKYYPIPYEIAKINKICVASAVVLILGMKANMGGLAVTLLLKAGLTVVVFPLLLRLTGVVSEKELEFVWRYAIVSGHRIFQHNRKRDAHPLD